MLWFSVWTVLVVGTLVGAWFLLRSLWRSARDLLTELGRASQVVADLTEQVEELRRLQEAASSPVRHTLFADKDVLRAQRARLRLDRDRRRELRWERDEATRARWRAVWR
ncbi:hypothetical protein ACTHAM_002684 [Cellulomonas soli]|uniref:hypothetical protein n=1 Tax=Cellulomonas soli TaxID=931535 RepID=UPI003F8297D6